MNDTTSPTPDFRGLTLPTGWVCPRCNSCISPFIAVCPHCQPSTPWPSQPWPSPQPPFVGDPIPVGPWSGPPSDPAHPIYNRAQP